LIQQMKTQIELDLSIEGDRQLMELILKYKAAQAQGQKLTIGDLVPHDSPSVKPLYDANKQNSEAATELKRVLGDDSKMSNKERASVAAKARWAKFRAEKDGTPLPKTKSAQQKKQEKKKSLAFKGAEHIDLDSLEEKDGEMIFQGTGFIPKKRERVVPDPRKIMEGDFDDDGLTEEVDEIEDLMDEETIRSVNAAAKYDN
jgi:hypothetical protein